MIKCSHGLQKPPRVQRRLAVTAGQQVVKASDRLGVKDFPSLRPIRELATKKEASRISLSGIVFAWVTKLIGSVDRFPPGNRLVMSQGVHWKGNAPHVGLEQDQPSDFGKNAARFAQECIGSLKMMIDIEEN